MILARMSPEQRDDFYVYEVAITVVLFSAVVGTLFGALFILIGQLARESSRIRAEARAAKARRLRYLADDTEAVVHETEPLQPLIERIHPKRIGPLPRHGPFHIFLSHNWYAPPQPWAAATMRYTTTSTSVALGRRDERFLSRRVVSLECASSPPCGRYEGGRATARLTGSMGSQRCASSRRDCSR